MKYLEEITVKKSDAVFGVSDYVSNWRVMQKAKKHFGTVYNIPNIPDINLSDNKRSVRQELGIDKNDIVVVSTGRIVKEKGYDIFWEAIRFIGKRSNLKYVIVGDGEYRKEWEYEVKSERYDDMVHFLGYREDIGEILKESDIFMICTKHETLCNSLLEAGYFGLPLIATRIGGIPEIVDDYCGYLVENQDVLGFSNALNALIENSCLRETKGKFAREKIVEKFNQDNIISRLNKIYEEMIFSIK